MGIWDVFRQPDINQGIVEYRAAAGSILLDVRTAEEYREGHIPGSINLPLQMLERVSVELPDRDAALFVYCRSGARSREAAGILKRMGYANVKNLGGIISYTGEIGK